MAASDSLPSRSNAQLKTPKGTRDWVGPDLILRDHIFQVASDTFKRHGGIPLDTPVFELRSILSEKYGEDQRLIYNVEDQGGELCSLRYDLTVPFARWLAMHSNVKQVKRYQIAKVYRRDQPAISRGRLREFYQCDFDIAGVYDPMIPDAEIIRVIFEVFRALDLEVIVKVNHRRILDGLFTVAGVPPEKLRPISSAVDKLDKASWDEVKKEMVEKGLSEAVADRVGEYVRRSGTMEETLEVLRLNQELMANDEVKAGVVDMELLAQYLKAMSVSDIASFDLSLARGLDYYTGLIYEVIAKPTNGQSVHVGSVAAGGRYDGLVGMYGKRPIPCVGLSFGVDRVFTILEARQTKKNKNDITREIDVYVMAAGGKGFDGLLQERMAIASQLWDAGIRAEFHAKVKPKMLQQFNASEDVPVAVILGDDELAVDQVRLKDARAGDKEAIEKNRGELIKREDLVEEVKKLLAKIALE